MCRKITRGKDIHSCISKFVTSQKVRKLVFDSINDGKQSEELKDFISNNAQHFRYLR